MTSAADGPKEDSPGEDDVVPDLCSWCSQLDFESIANLFPIDSEIAKHSFHHEKSYDMDCFVVANVGLRVRTEKPPRCRFCQVLHEQARTSKVDLRSKETGQGDVLVARSLRQIMEIDFGNASLDDTVLLVIPKGELDKQLYVFYKAPASICITRNQDATSLYRPILPTVDYEVIHSWLSKCNNHHSKCKKEPRKFSLSLVDCENRRIVPSDSSTVYLALSYVWGEIRRCTIGSDLRLPDDLPKTIADAITFTLNAGYRYLWVDQLCIDQNDAQKKSEQISQMDLIYGTAELTLVAAAGIDSSFGLPGVSSKLRPGTYLTTAPEKGNSFVIHQMKDFQRDAWNISSSKWASRGWTFQESFLSQRLLIFAKDQLYFECGSVRCLESIKIEEVGSRSNPKFNTHVMGPISKTRAMDHQRDDYDINQMFSNFGELIRFYSSRKLTDEGDILNAVTGIMKYLEPPFTKIKDSVFIDVSSKEEVVVDLRSFWGIPHLVSSSVDREVQKALHALTVPFLCWRRKFPSEAKRRSQFPSWSWAGWTGGLAYTEYSYTCYRKVLLEDIQFEIEGSRVSASQCWNGSLQHNILRKDQKPRIHLNMVILPSDLLHHRTSHPWAIEERNSFVSMARKHGFQWSFMDFYPATLEINGVFDSTTSLGASQVSDILERTTSGNLVMGLVGDTGDNYLYPRIAILLLQRTSDCYEMDIFKGGSAEENLDMPRMSFGAQEFPFRKVLTAGVASRFGGDFKSIEEGATNCTAERIHKDILGSEILFVSI
ncbi:hypothetical protein HYFRA_00000960 [Hymenoscyphus fraxineus]|uniref:Heterokaryon incompatibility domain-containing protein n=1 Tax=Hymenoscyphus fraxineus TaxID=746836 RepID=A0A9N9PQL5_9HELO|nr:hypothetical protein HYFRA_00000960 [Hymenoscyphus fraxineus]